MTATDDRPEEAFALTTSRGFVAWLAGSGGSIAFTTYQAGMRTPAAIGFKTDEILRLISIDET